MDKTLGSQLSQYVETRSSDELNYVDVLVSPLGVPVGLDEDSLALPLVSVLATSQYVVLVGPPGSGKSEALRHLCYSAALAYASGASSIYPIILDAHQCDWASPTGLQKSIAEWLPAETEPTSISILLLIDGMDETADDLSSRLLEALWHARRTSSDPQLAKVVVATRRLRPRLLDYGFMGVALLPFNDLQVREYMERTLSNVAHGCSASLLGLRRFGQLVRNPFLLSLIVRQLARSGEACPTAADLLAPLEKMIGDVVRSISQQTGVSVGDLYEVLGKLGAEMELQGHGYVSGIRLSHMRLDDHLGTASAGKTRDVVQCAIDAGLLTFIHSDFHWPSLHFTHATFQEFFFTEHLRRRLGVKTERASSSEDGVRFALHIPREWSSVDGFLDEVRGVDARLRSVGLTIELLYARRGSLYLLLLVQGASLWVLGKFLGAVTERFGEKFADRILHGEGAPLPDEVLATLPDWIAKDPETLKAYRHELAREYAREPLRQQDSMESVILVVEAAARDALGDGLARVPETTMMDEP